MSKNILMILAVIVTVLTGWLVIQVASMEPATADVRGGAMEYKAPVQRANGGSTVKVKTSVNVSDNDVSTSVNVR